MAFSDHVAQLTVDLLLDEFALECVRQPFRHVLFYYVAVHPPKALRVVIYVQLLTQDAVTTHQQDVPIIRYARQDLVQLEPKVRINTYIVLENKPILGIAIGYNVIGHEVAQVATDGAAGELVVLGAKACLFHLGNLCVGLGGHKFLDGQLFTINGADPLELLGPQIGFHVLLDEEIKTVFVAIKINKINVNRFQSEAGLKTSSPITKMFNLFFEIQTRGKYSNNNYTRNDSY